MAGASRASNEGTRFDTEATSATPQNAPTSDQHAIRILPNGLTGLSRYPSMWATGLGTRCHLGAGTNGFMKRSMSKCQVDGLDRVDLGAIAALGTAYSVCRSYRYSTRLRSV